MRLLRFLLKTAKGVYDILASYLLAWILLFALAAFGLHLGLEALADHMGYGDAPALWARWSGSIGVTDHWLRIALLAPLHALFLWALRHPLERVFAGAERAVDLGLGGWRWLSRRSPALASAAEIGFTLGVSALLVPFVIQPTLEPRLLDGEAWVERGANLLDGTASASIADSVVGLYRKLYAEPVPSTGMPGPELDDAFDELERPGPAPGPPPAGVQPMMDRWDPYIRRVTGGDPERFAMVKTFMWVESAGRQYAVSHTGCSGLMQFCAGTARGEPFREVFGVGQVITCGCDGPCTTPREVQRALESGDPSALKRYAADFPCDLRDARFHPDKSIAAGGLYVDRLRASYGANLELMYIGYNSGPAVADALWKRVGRDPHASLAQIAPHLAGAMRPYYGARSEGRARSLVRTHLPKLRGAYERYLRAAKDTGDAHGESINPSTLGDESARTSRSRGR